MCDAAGERSITFQRVFDDSTVTFSMPADMELGDMVTAFENFLRAVGYVFDGFTLDFKEVTVNDQEADGEYEDGEDFEQRAHCPECAEAYATSIERTVDEACNAAASAPCPRCDHVECICDDIY